MKLLWGILLILAAAAAGWWLFWLTPSRGGSPPNELRLSVWGDYEELQMWRQIIARFEQTHRPLTVKLEYVPLGAGSYDRKLRAWMASGTSPDVMLLQDELYPQYLARPAEQRPVVNLTDMVSGRGFGSELGLDPNDYFDGAWRSFGQDGPDGWEQFGLPVWGGNNLIFYNRDCFRAAGVALPEQSGIDADWTVEEFLDLCRQLTLRDADGRVTQWGFVLPYSWLYFQPFLYACDAEILSDDRSEFVFTGPEAERALQLWLTLGREGLVPTGGDLGPMNQNVAFLTGKVAMVCNGPWLMPFFNEAELDYGLMHVPVSPTGRRGTRVTWTGVGIAGRLRDDPQGLRDAWLLARFLAGPEAAALVGRAQRSIPALRDHADSFVAADDQQRGLRFVEALAYSRLQPITVHWQEMDWALRDGWVDAGDPDSTPEAALAEIRRLILRRDAFPVRMPDGRLIQPGDQP